MNEQTTINDEVKSALKKKAVGYEAQEVVEEYQDTDEGLVLTKKKITQKHYPPDTTAAKMILDVFSEQQDYSMMTDEELEKEKQRLLKLIKEQSNEN